MRLQRLASVRALSFGDSILRVPRREATRRVELSGRPLLLGLSQFRSASGPDLVLEQPAQRGHRFSFAPKDTYSAPSPRPRTPCPLHYAQTDRPPSARVEPHCQYL